MLEELIELLCLLKLHVMRVQLAFGQILAIDPGRI